MSQSVNVRAIQTLRDLDNALARFRDTAKEALESTRREVQRAREWLEGRQSHWQREVESSRRKAGEAESSPTSEGDLPDSEAELANVLRWVRELNDAEEEYQVHARRMDRLISVEIPRAQALLRQKIADLERYLAVSPEASQGGVGAVGPLPVTQLVASLRDSGPMGDIDLRVFLSTNIPGAHMLRFEVVQNANVADPESEGDVIGRGTQPLGRKLTFSAHLQNPQTSYDENVLTQTMCHEVGSGVHRNVLDDEGRSRWEETSGESGSGGPVSEYAGQGVGEDFSESYGFYVTDPDALRDISPEKYRFLRDRVFDGREYE